MILNRILPIIMLAGASAWAQLPPSALNPTRPVPGGPVRPAVPARPAAPAAPAPATTLEPAPGVAIDMTNIIPNTLTAEEQAQGWKLLFDGTRLLGLKGVQRGDPLGAGWKIRDGELNLPKEIRDMDRMTGGDLITVEAFVDFDFRFEWKASTSSNSGVRYMVNQTIGQTPTGLEYQIIDDTHSSLGLKGGALRHSGALDNVLPVGPNAQLRTADPLNRKGDPWNEGRIIVQGNHVEHWMNGEKVLEFELGPQLRAIAARNVERGGRQPGPYFGTKVRTPIVLLDEGLEVAFRNLKIRPLLPQAVIATPNTPRPAPTGTAPAPAPAPAPVDPFLVFPKKK